MDRARALQIAIACLISGALLVETYVLFDDDLGTPIPIFHEFTCRGKLDVRATDGYGNGLLRQPNSGLNASAAWAGTLVPAYFQAFQREGTGPWVPLPPSIDDSGWHVFFIEQVTPTTQAYVIARDLSGTRCDATSVVIHAAPQAPPVVTTPTVPTEPVPATPPPIVPPDCATFAVELRADGENLTASLISNSTAEGEYTLYASNGTGFSPVANLTTATRTATFPRPQDATAAFVHVDFRPTYECAKDSRVLRFTPSA